MHVCRTLGKMKEGKEGIWRKESSVIVKSFQKLPCFQHHTKQGCHVNLFTTSMPSVVLDFSVSSIGQWMNACLKGTINWRPLAYAFEELTVTALEHLIQHTDGFVCTVIPMADISQYHVLIFVKGNSDQFSFDFSVLSWLQFVSSNLLECLYPHILYNYCWRNSHC